MDQEFNSIYLQRQLFVPQQSDEDIFPYFSTLFSPRDWVVTEKSSLKTPSGISYKRFSIRKKNGSDQWLIYASYNVGGISTDNKIVAKLLQLLATINHRPYSVITLLTKPCINSCIETSEERFIIEDIISSKTIKH